MSNLEIFLSILCGFQFLVLMFVFYKLGKVAVPAAQLKVQYFEDVIRHDGYFKTSFKVRLKGQLYLGDVPIGAATVLAEQETTSINKEVVDQVKKEMIDSVKSTATFVLTNGLSKIAG